METTVIHPARDALIVTDLQPDFMPGGALPVAGGDLIVEPINELLGRRLFARVVATQDWHPAGHLSFASSHPGRQPFDVTTLHGHPQTLWPDHCVQGTPGADLHPSLRADTLDLVLRKGQERDVDSYSCLRSNHGPGGRRPATGLAGWLRELGIERVFLCGLALDFCVKWSAEDAAAAGFGSVVLRDLTRAVDPASDPEVERDLGRHGVRIIESLQLRGARPTAAGA